MYYTTKQVADKIPVYNSSRSLLEALYNNQKGITESSFLKDIWDCRQRVGKRWLFKKDEIDLILGHGSSENGGSGTSIKGDK